MFEDPAIGLSPLPDVVDRSDIERALAGQRALLHEVDHRVKNNLQLICSLMLLQSRRLEDAPARAALLSALERVNAIGIVHRRLFQGEDLERFDIAQFVRDLVADLVGAANRGDVQVRLDLERVDVPTARAAPLALIVNELTTNALRHGFPPGRSGIVAIRVRRFGDDFEIDIRDDGVGFPGAPPEKGFGLTVSDLLCRQLRADCRFESLQPGARATVRLSIDPP